MRKLGEAHELIKLGVGLAFVIICAMLFANIADITITFLAPGENISSVFKANQVVGLFVLIINHLGMFIVPALLMQLFFSTKEEPYISFKTAAIKKYGIALLILLAIIFGSGVIVKITELIINLTPLEEWAHNLQNRSTDTLQNLLARDKNFGVLALKILTIAIIPAIGEELIFRGILIKNFFRLTKNHHVAVVISSILFSLMHFQPYNFFAFIVIGMAFGYIYWKTKDIKISMLLHFLFNLSSLLLHEFGVFEM